MIFTGTKIHGLFLIQPKRFEDQRGYFIKTFHAETFKPYGLNEPFVESYFSSSDKNVIRGMHFQTPPHEHTKLVYVSRGAATDVIVDLRRHSPTYGQFVSSRLDENNGFMFLIPKGCAHGFLALENNTVMTYNQTTMYAPDNDGGIRYDSFGFDWKIDNPVMSDRDLKFPTLADFKSPFTTEVS